jgi:dTMP kinase
MGRFITFEGIEGCGKTTQVKMAGAFLQQREKAFVVTEEPGGTPVGRRIRELLLNEGLYEKHPICAEAEVLLFSAARAQHVRDIILPALQAGQVVLCDRFTDATLAYQGWGRGLNIDFIKGLNTFASFSLKPDLTLLFDLPVEIGLKRAMDRIANLKESNQKKSKEQLAFDFTLAEDRFEQEAVDFHRKVRESYLSLAKQEPERFRVIDGSKDITTVHQEVAFHLATLIEREG